MEDFNAVLNAMKEQKQMSMQLTEDYADDKNEEEVGSCRQR